MVYIYSLSDSKGIRYIGKSCNTVRRLKSHILEAQSPKSRGCHRIHWLRSLLASGQQPLLAVLEVCNDDNWAEREKHWIAHGKICGWELTNNTEGGDGNFRFTDDVKKKISDKAKERMKEASRRDAVSQWMTKCWKDKSFRQLQIDNRRREWQDNERVRKASENAKERFKNEAYRQKNKDTQKCIWSSDDAKLLNSERAKKHWSDPVKREAKSKQSIAYIKLHPELRETISIAAKKQWADPDFKKRMSDQRKALRSTPEWRAKASIAAKLREETKRLNREKQCPES
jgi:hypothetical protein